MLVYQVIPVLSESTEYNYKKFSRAQEQTLWLLPYPSLYT